MFYGVYKLMMDRYGYVPDGQPRSDGLRSRPRHVAGVGVPVAGESPAGESAAAPGVPATPGQLPGAEHDGSLRHEATAA